ncbi:hypothetical protein POM88_048940 [Heracleum sosnowskyi]|uniref:SKP1-like protein n=1 Tax=Heracleum sosnowskyi TaxID=360622 RepID=A0AAD8M0Y7_9APIA|nr:hypothetical protein POM88_048940 [Heracleum sosnowskyi]
MASASKMIMLRSSDNETFKVEEAVAFLSKTIKHMIEHDCADTVIHLPKVSSTILAKVIEYCKKHVTSPKGDNETNKTAEDNELKSFDEEFVKVDKKILFGLIMAANYLKIKSLSDLTCQAVDDMIEEKTPEEIRNFFGIDMMTRKNI